MLNLKGFHVYQILQISNCSQIRSLHLLCLSYSDILKDLSIRPEEKKIRRLFVESYNVWLFFDKKNRILFLKPFLARFLTFRVFAPFYNNQAKTEKHLFFSRKNAILLNSRATAISSDFASESQKVRFSCFLLFFMEKVLFFNEVEK